MYTIDRILILSVHFIQMWSGRRSEKIEVVLDDKTALVLPNVTLLSLHFFLFVLFVWCAIKLYLF